MFKKILNLFSKNEKVQEDKCITAEDLFPEDEIEIPSDTPCGSKCFVGKNTTDQSHNCPKTCPRFKNLFLELPDFDATKDSILIVDDNPGIISFLMDDIEYLDGKQGFNINDYNILTFDTQSAAYKFEVTQSAYNGLNIKFAILDLTLGGPLNTDKGIVKYTGVDIYQQILVYNPEVKVLFYTGNSLNEYVKSTKKIIDQFSKLKPNEHIKQYVLFKTTLDMDERREYLLKWFTS